jgi:hypothetical protein
MYNICERTHKFQPWYHIASSHDLADAVRIIDALKYWQNHSTSDKAPTATTEWQIPEHGQAEPILGIRGLMESNTESR